jgi:hypothetical protein
MLDCNGSEEWSNYDRPKGDLKSGASPFNVDLKSGSIHTMNLKSGIPHGFCPPVLSGIVTLVS